MRGLPRWVQYVVSVAVAVCLAAIIQRTLMVRMANRQDGMYPGLPIGKSYWVYRRAYSRPAQVGRGDIVAGGSPTQGAAYRYFGRVVCFRGAAVGLSSGQLSIKGPP